MCADIEIAEWKARCEERDAEIRRLRAREIVLERQLYSLRTKLKNAEAAQNFCGTSA